MPLRVANLPAEHGKLTKRNPSTRGQKSQCATATSRSRARCARDVEYATMASSRSCLQPPGLSHSLLCGQFINHFTMFVEACSADHLP